MNKTIIVTGAGRGLGYSIVSQHLDLKDRVFAFDYYLTDELKQLAAISENLRIYHCDISSTESVVNATRDAISEGKQVDILYNVAGIFRFDEKVGLAETDLDTCMTMYNINAVGALRVCKAVLPLIQKGSLVVNISSEAGSISATRRKQEYSYCMSKAAMNMGTKILSNELWDRSARIINFHPGWMRTAMGGQEAMNSKNSVSPDESANHIVNIALKIDQIPRDQMFMTHTGEILPW